MLTVFVQSKGKAQRGTCASQSTYCHLKSFSPAHVRTPSSILGKWVALCHLRGCLGFARAGTLERKSWVPAPQLYLPARQRFQSVKFGDLSPGSQVTIGVISSRKLPDDIGTPGGVRTDGAGFGVPNRCKYPCYRYGLII